MVRYANLYWLVTVSGFQGSGCSGFPAYPAVLPAACRLSCVRRQGDTLRTRREAVNGFPELSSPALRPVFRAQIQGNTNASRDPPEGVRAAWRRITATAISLWFRLPILAGFQHALQCLNDLDAVRCCTVPASAGRCKGLAPVSSIYPRILRRPRPCPRVARSARAHRSRATPSCERRDGQIGACRPGGSVPQLSHARSSIPRPQVNHRRASRRPDRSSCALLPLRRPDRAR